LLYQQTIILILSDCIYLIEVVRLSFFVISLLSINQKESQYYYLEILSILNFELMTIAFLLYFIAYCTQNITVRSSLVII